MESFHSTLLDFFKKNFQDEIQRLAAGPQALDTSLSSAEKQSTPSRRASIEQRSKGHNGTAMRQQITIAPLDLGRSVTTSSISPPSTRENEQSPVEMAMSTKQTPLQRGMAHLARHGFNGVASGPRDTVDGEMSEESPRDSFVNGSGPAVTHLSGAASITPSTVASSFRGRFSRLGSLHLGRRES